MNIRKTIPYLLLGLAIAVLVNFERSFYYFIVAVPLTTLVLASLMYMVLRPLTRNRTSRVGKAFAALISVLVVMLLAGSAWAVPELYGQMRGCMPAQTYHSYRLNLITMQCVYHPGYPCIRSYPWYLNFGCTPTERQRNKEKKGGVNVPPG